MIYFRICLPYTFDCQSIGGLSIKIKRREGLYFARDRRSRLLAAKIHRIEMKFFRDLNNTICTNK